MRKAFMVLSKKEKLYQFIVYKKLYPDYCRWIKSDDKYFKMSSCRKMYLYICHKKLLREYQKQIIIRLPDNVIQFLPEWRVFQIAKTPWLE